MTKYIVSYTSHEEVIEAEDESDAIDIVEGNLREEFGTDLTNRLVFEAWETI
jgi:hypothetical protein